MESPAGSKENHEPFPGFDLTKAMNSTATAVRAEPIPDSACLTPRNGKRKMPPPAPLLAALFGPDYQTMSPDPRLPPFNERVTGMHAPSGVAPTVGGAPSPSGLSLFSAVRGGPATVSKLPDSLRRSHASGAATVADLGPRSIAAPNAGGAEEVPEDGTCMPAAGGTGEQGRGRPSSAAALGDVQAAILYAEAEHIMEFLQLSDWRDSRRQGVYDCMRNQPVHLQERRNLARLASEFDARLRTLCDVFCSTSPPSKPTSPAVAAATPASNPSEQNVKQEDAKPEPAYVSGAPSNAVEGQQPAKRRRRPPAKHEGFDTTDAATLDSETPLDGARTGKDDVADCMGKSKAQKGAMYEGVMLDGAAAADHTAALYCAINESLEKLASRKMYKSGATTLRASVDRALLMCSQLEAGTGTEGTIVLESVLNNPLPHAKFQWSRRHEALRLARLALHSLHRLFVAGLGDFNLEVTFSPSCALTPPTAAAAATDAAPPAGGAQETSAAATTTRTKETSSNNPQTLKVASPSRAALPASAVAAAGAAMAAQAKLGIPAESGSPRSEQDCDGAGEDNGGAPMDTDAPGSNTPTAAVSTGAAGNGTHALSRSASCVLDGDAVLRTGDTAACEAVPNAATRSTQRAAGDAATPKLPQHGTSTPVPGSVADHSKEDKSPSLLHALANAATASAPSPSPKASDTSQGQQTPLGSSPPAMAPANATHDSHASAQHVNVANLVSQWRMPLAQAASMPEGAAGATAGGVGLGRPTQSLPEGGLPHALGAMHDNTAMPAGDAMHSGQFSSGGFSGFAGFGSLLPPGKSVSNDHAAFPAVELLSRPGGPPLASGGAVTTDELMNAFDEASDLRLRALGAMGGAMTSGRGGKRRRVDGGRTFHQSIGIGNVGKKGGSDTPGGVQVSMVALCNYILTHGGWEKMKSDREAKLELLKHFGWDHGLPAGKSAVFKEDKAIQSLTTQVREYFVKTGVFHVLSTNRVSVDGTTTTSGAADNSPTDFTQQHQPLRSAPDIHATPVLHGFNASTSGPANKPSSAEHHGPAPYNVPMHHGAFTDPTDQHHSSLAFSLAGQGVLPVSCNTDPLPQRSMQDMHNRLSQHGGMGPSMLPGVAQPTAQLPAALPLPLNAAGAGGVPVSRGDFPMSSESILDRSTALHMRALMEAMHMIQTHGADSVAAQHACMIAQATGRLGPQAGMHGLPGSTGLDQNPHASGMMAGDMDLMRQLASQMPLNAATHTGTPLVMSPQHQTALELMCLPTESTMPFSAPPTSGAASCVALALTAPTSPATGNTSGGIGAMAPSAFVTSVGAQVSGCGVPSGGATVSGGIAAGGSSAGNQGVATNDASASSAGGTPSAPK